MSSNYRWRARQNIQNVGRYKHFVRGAKTDAVREFWLSAIRLERAEFRLNSLRARQ